MSASPWLAQWRRDLSPRGGSCNCGGGTMGQQQRGSERIVLAACASYEWAAMNCREKKPTPYPWQPVERPHLMHP